jgi:hypothetical protein
VPVEIDKVKELGFYIDESDLVLHETVILDAVIQIENDEFDEEVVEEDVATLMHSFHSFMNGIRLFHSE